ncbi:vWA domain-containing protein [Sulfurimonas sp.]
MYDGIYFEFPKLLFLIFFFIACASLCKMKMPSIYFPHTSQFVKNGASASKLLFLLKWTAIVMMILALMSPVKDEPYEAKPKNGHEIALILDASGSMNERGFNANNPAASKFDVVKSIVKDFISKRTNDNMGLVVFGQFSFVASPLTYDKHILSGIVSQLEVRMAGQSTALYEGLAQGINVLKMSHSKSKIAILLTDGYSTAGVDKIPLDVAIDMAKKEGVKVYTIGVGAPDEYNRAVLMKIAKETGGVAFGASNAHQLEEIYQKIDKLEKSKIKNETFTYMKYYYTYPLFLGLLSLLFYVFLRNKRGASR